VIDHQPDQAEAGRRDGAPDGLRRAGIAVTALALAAASFAFVVGAFGEDAEPNPAIDGSAAWHVREYEVGADPGELIVAEGSVWIARDGVVTRVDPDTGDMQHVPIALTESGSRAAVSPESGLTYGDGTVWLVAQPFFAGIDPRTGDLRSSFVWESGVTSVAYHDGRLFYGGSAEGNGKVSAVDPDDLSSESWIAGDAYPSVAPTDPWIWSGDANRDDDQPALTRTAPDREPTQAIVAVTAVDSMASTDRALWVTGDGTLWKVDASPPDAGATQDVFPEAAEAILLQRPVAGGARVATGGGHLWLLEPGTESSTVTELDPATAEALGPAITVSFAGEARITVDETGTPWVTFRREGTLVGLSRDAQAPCSPSSSPDPAYLPSDEGWAPETYEDDGMTVMPITFPNGVTAELAYADDLALEALHVHPSTFVEGPGDCGQSLEATRHDPRGGWVTGAAPLRTFTRRDGGVVELWNGTRSHEPHDFLIYRVGDWSITTPCRNGETLDTETFETWADRLEARQSSDGLLVIDARAPLDPNPYEDRAVRFSGRDVVVEVSATDGCEARPPDKGADDGVIQWCLEPESGIYLYATAFAPSGKEILDDVVRSFEVRAVSDP
jgi:hypothetical protein